MSLRTYSELQTLLSFEERYEYLVLGGEVGHSTFGFDRYINQEFYRSREWRTVRDEVILRDNGCDLGVPGFEIQTDLVVHHMNPMTSDHIIQNESWIVDPEFLITTTLRTHNDIHYGNKVTKQIVFAERVPGDTALW